jgi:F-box protein 18 (helicase)
VLENLAHNNPDMRFLYLAFNRSVRFKAKTSFPSNVQCDTFNSLAWRLVGVDYVKGGILNGISFRSICIEFKVPLKVSASIRTTLENFLNSSSMDISSEHLFVHPKINSDPDIEEFIIRSAKNLWSIMVGGDNKWLRMTQSGCLKLLHLKQLELGAECILCDESQDTNPVSMSILEKERSRGCALVIAGDPRQQIYSWRGAVDAMQCIDCESFNLTQSFRFNRRVAYMANKLLKGYGISMFDLVGSSGRTDHLYGVSIPPGMRNGTHAYLARTNVGAFGGIIDLIDQGETVAFNGDVGVFIGTIVDIYALKSNRPDDVSKYGRLKHYKSYEDFLDVCGVDPELNSLKNIVEKFGNKIPDMVERINDCLARDAKFATVVVSTVHKAKGMEYDCVTMADDFTPLVKGKKLLPIRTNIFEKRGDVVDQEDLHIIYVAITRAKCILAVPQTLLDFLEALRAGPDGPVFYKPGTVENSGRAKDFAEDFKEDMGVSSSEY